ncbi:hypothetical protein OROHE_008110 [Orobanche hederae]
MSSSEKDIESKLKTPIKEGLPGSSSEKDTDCNKNPVSASSRFLGCFAEEQVELEKEKFIPLQEHPTLSRSASPRSTSPEVIHTFLKVQDTDKLRKTLRLCELKRGNVESVCCTFNSDVERVGAYLSTNGVSAVKFYRNLPKLQKKSAEQNFKEHSGMSERAVTFINKRSAGMSLMKLVEEGIEVPDCVKQIADEWKL